MSIQEEKFSEIAHAARFDKVSAQYIEDLNKNLSLTGSDSSYFYRIKIQLIKNKITMPPATILDFGCGIGILSRLLAEAFPASRIIGVDPSQESLRIAEQASKTFGDQISYIDQLQTLPIQPNLVIATGVFHHIHYSYQQKNLNHLYSCMDENADLFVFEHNPLNPATRMIVARAEVDRDASLIYPWAMKKMFKLAGFEQSKLEFISFFPAWLSFLLTIEPYLKKIPLGAQYLMTGKKVTTFAS